jgi:hypothetical protein
MKEKIIELIVDNTGVSHEQARIITDKILKLVRKYTIEEHIKGF